MTSRTEIKMIVVSTIIIPLILVTHSEICKLLFRCNK